MRVVPTLPFGANGCAVLPGRGDVTEKGGFIDTGRELQGVDPHVFVSAAAVREMARLLDEPLTNAELEQAKARVRELEVEVESLREFERSTIYTLDHLGQKVRKKPGRKPKQEEVTV